MLRKRLKSLMLGRGNSGENTNMARKQTLLSEIRAVQKKHGDFE